MLPFSIELRSGEPVFQQVVYAVEKAIVAQTLQPGDRFPSVRKLSQALRINPNTAHKIVASLVQQGLLEVRPGIGTLIAQTQPAPDPAAGRELLGETLERLAVDARRHGLSFDAVVAALGKHWDRLGGQK